MSKGLRRSLYEFITFRSFFSRFWWALLLLSLLSSLAYALFSAHFRTITSQRVNSRVAEALAKQLEPHLKGPVDTALIQSQIAHLSEFNPAADIFLYRREKQELIASDSVSRFSLDLRPVYYFIKRRGDVTKPIFLETKNFPGIDSDKRTFSAWPIRIEGEWTYLIVILGGKRYGEVAQELRGEGMVMLGYTLLGSVVLLTSLLGFLVVFLLTRRFSRMIAIVKAFQSGRYEVRIGDSSTDEMGTYARAFDQMADTIVRHMRELEQQDMSRRALVAEVSHELRRPLALMNLSLETLSEENELCSAEERRTYIKQSLESGENLARLIADLFELSKLNAAATPPLLECCEVEDLAEDIIAKFRKSAAERNIELKVEYTSPLPEILADIALLDRALSNLIENALRYTGAGGQVSLILRATDTELQVSVKDSGSGIRKEDISHIFDRFYRGGGQEEEQSGAGLGLAITKRIVEVHGGIIEARNCTEGGTLFLCRLPYRVGALRSARVALAAPND